MNPHTQTIDLWVEAFQNKFGVKYIFTGGKDGKSVKALLEAGMSPEEIRDLAVRAWNAPAGAKFWNCHHRCLTICDFTSVINKVRAELATTTTVEPGRF